MKQDPRRTLTDDDVEAITEALRDKVITEFYQDLGKGTWALVWRALIIAAIAIAAIGSGKSLWG